MYWHLAFNETNKAIMRHLFWIFIILISCSEQDTEATQKEVYTGPVRIAKDVDMYYSEGTLKLVKIEAPTLIEHQDGNREFPDGYYLEFYEKDGTLSSTLRADRGFHYKSEDLWKATGNVIVKSAIKEEQLNTEELFWKPSEEKIFTDKFVTVRTVDKLVNATGFESNQDFTDYSFKDVHDSEFFLE